MRERSSIFKIKSEIPEFFHILFFDVEHSLKDKSLSHFFELLRFLVAGDHSHSLLLVRQINTDSNTYPLRNKV